MNIYLFWIIFTVGASCLIFTAFTKCVPPSMQKHKNLSTGMIMTDNREINTLQKLHALYDFTNSIDMIDLTKRSILDKIKFEVELMESQVYRQLGKEKYEDMKLPKLSEKGEKL